MCVIFTPAMRLNNSALRCGSAPVPGAPELMAPGLALASAMNDRMSFAVSAGCMTITNERPRGQMRHRHEIPGLIARQFRIQ